MAHIFVFHAKRSVFRTARSEDDGVLRPRAADEAHVAQALLVGLVAKGARSGNGAAVCFRRKIDTGSLPADRCRKLDGVVDTITGAGIDADKLVALAHLHRLQNANGLAAAALGADAHIEECFDVR